MTTSYSVYLVRCVDGTYYTGITTDIDRRVREHNCSLRGARYTKSRRPVSLVYVEACSSRGAAQRREYALRNLSHEQKQVLDVKSA